MIEDTYGVQRVKLASGSLVLYPASSLHRVEPVTRGIRLASFFWIQSLVRHDAQRALLFDLDMAIIRLTNEHPDDPALVSLVGVYHNLLRMWAAPSAMHPRRDGAARGGMPVTSAPPCPPSLAMSSSSVPATTG